MASNAVIKEHMKLQTGDLFKKSLKLCNIFDDFSVLAFVLATVHFVLMKEA